MTVALNLVPANRSRSASGASIWLLFALAFALAFAPCQSFAASQDVHRCVVGGRVVYQQVACSASGSTMREDLDKAAKAKAAEVQRMADEAKAERMRIDRLDALPSDRLSRVEQLEREHRRLVREMADDERKRRDGTRDREYQEALDRHCQGKEIEALAVGQTEQQVLNCSIYRKPTRVNTTTTAAGVRKQLIFDRGGAKEHYLYFLNGVLTSFQQ